MTETPFAPGDLAMPRDPNDRRATFVVDSVDGDQLQLRIGGGVLEPAPAADYVRVERRRHAHEVQGMVLRDLRTGMVVVPYERQRGYWYCVVVDPGPDPACQKSYPRGGYHIVVGNEELESAEAVPLSPAPSADALAAAQARIAELEAVVNAVRRLHGQRGPLAPGEWCPGCGDRVPCATERTIRGLPAPTAG